MSKFSRRDFVKGGASALGAGMMLPVINRKAEGSTVVSQLADNTEGNGNILVIVELSGGIDGLNVIVPYQAYDTYAALRPSIGIPKELLVPLYGNTTMAMCPELAYGRNTATGANAGLKEISDAGKLAVIQAVGYPTPNLSHFTSRDIWYSAINNASISTAQRTGWIGRHSVLFGSPSNALDTIGVGGAIPLPLYASGVSVAGLTPDSNGNPTGYTMNTDSSFTGDRTNKLTAAQVFDPATSNSSFIDLWEKAELNAINGSANVAAAAAAYTSTVTYPSTSFAYGLKMIAKMATSTAPALGTRVFYISTGGFDTHSNQATYKDGSGNILPTFSGDLPRLLGTQIGNSLRAFYDDMKAKGLENQLMIMTFSEFGRRVAQNAGGTDHGTANNVLIMGGRVNGGVYGADPSLTNLSGGNLVYKIDFRQIYATIISNWLGGDPVAVLNGTFSPLTFV